MDNNIIINKYLKYKNKYLLIKHHQKGGNIEEIKSKIKQLFNNLKNIFNININDILVYDIININEQLHSILIILLNYFENYNTDLYNYINTNNNDNDKSNIIRLIYILIFIDNITYQILYNLMIFQTITLNINNNVKTCSMTIIKQLLYNDNYNIFIDKIINLLNNIIQFLKIIKDIVNDVINIDLIIKTIKYINFMLSIYKIFINNKIIYKNITSKYESFVETLIELIYNFLNDKNVKINIYKLLLPSTLVEKEATNLFTAHEHDMIIPLERLPNDIKPQTTEKLSKKFSFFNFFKRSKNIELCDSKDEKYKAQPIKFLKITTISINLEEILDGNKPIYIYLKNIYILFNNILKTNEEQILLIINNFIEYIYNDYIIYYIKNLFNINEKIILNIGKILKDGEINNPLEALTYIILSIIFIISYILDINNIDIKLDDNFEYTPDNIINIIEKNIIILSQLFYYKNPINNSSSNISSNINDKLSNILEIIEYIIENYIVEDTLLSICTRRATCHILDINLEETLPSLKKIISSNNSNGDKIDIKDKYRLLLEIINIIKLQLKS
jgi:hypothetical protein